MGDLRAEDDETRPKRVSKRSTMIRAILSPSSDVSRWGSLEDDATGLLLLVSRGTSVLVPDLVDERVENLVDVYVGLG